jgi:hypothetical protein
VTTLCRDASGTYPWESRFVLAYAALDARDEHRALLADEPPSIGLEAAVAICDRDYPHAIRLYEQMGSATQAAETRLLAAADRAVPDSELGRAIDFFRSVRAVARVRQAEALLHASA